PCTAVACVSLSCFLFECHSGLSSPISSTSLPLTTDSPLFVISFSVTYSSLCLINNQAFGPMCGVLISANEPCSFSPCRINFTSPFFKPSGGEAGQLGSRWSFSYQPQSQIITLPAP